jgi:DNA-3-methyladenine glycosylase II
MQRLFSSNRSIILDSGDGASQALAAADRRLGALIQRIGHFERGPVEGGFPVIVRSIVGQQLSEKVAPIIWDRLVQRIGTTPDAIARATPDDLRGCGLSGRKVEYLQGIARATLSGEVDWDALEEEPDEQVIAELTKLRGIGRWTAEMYLIFSLGRPDVLALDDLGVRTSAGKMLGLGRPTTREELAERGELWRPYRSIASLWLWADQR